MKIGSELLVPRLIPALAMLVTACTSVPQPMSEAQYLLRLEQSAAVLEQPGSGARKDEAVSMLRDLAVSYPSGKEAWVRLARLHFDLADYGNAIVAADEVLRRDPQERLALSIRAVAGLRVATASLASLRGDAALQASAREDASSLVKALRETLGEDVLVPPVAVTPLRVRRADASVASRERSARAGAVAAAGAVQRRSAAAVAPPAGGRGSDPFSVFR